MAIPSAPSAAVVPPRLRAAALAALLVFLGTCRRDVTAPAAPTQLFFTVPPHVTAAGQPISPAVQVSALDESGRVVESFTGTITVTLGPATSGATLAGATEVSAVRGVATFVVSIAKSGSGYTLTATSNGLVGAISMPFGIVAGPPTQLLFTGQPTTTVAGASMTPAVQVTVQDAEKNTVDAFTGTVTLTLGSNAAAGTLGGTTTVAAVAGVATFTALRVDKAGTGYTLAAAAAGIPAATSASFTVAPGPGSQLVFTVQPTSAVAGAAISPAVQVTALDASGNTATGFSGIVALALGTNPGGGTLSGATTQQAVNGIATFPTLSIDKVGTGYTLTATGLGTAMSSPFDIRLGPISQLAFLVQPSNTVAGQPIAPAVQVRALDASGNPASAFAGTVSLSIGANPNGGALIGTTTVTAVGGVATFTTLNVNKAGSGYTLTAAAPGLAGAASAAFTIAPGSAAQLVFTGLQATTEAAGQPFSPAERVSVEDALGNVVSSFTGGVTIAIGLNPAGGTLAGTTTVAAVAGVATFTTLSIDKVGTGYTLTAAAPGLTGAATAAFNVVPGTATQLVFTTEPSTTVAGQAISPAVKVTALDASGNPVPGFTGTVTVALGTNPGSGVLSGTATVAAVEGVASFATLSVDKAGAGYTLTASAPGLTGATSTAFTVIAAAVSATQSTLGATPATIPASAGTSPATLTVTARDANGNPVSGATVMFAATGSGNLLTPAAGPTDANGVATGSLSSTVAGGKTVTVVVGGVTVTQTAAVTVTAGAASQLVFTGQPSTAVAGQPISPAVRVSAEDGFGNLVASYTGSVTVALGFNPAGGTLSGTKTVAAVNGVATFATLSLDKTGSGYTLTAVATGLSGATSTTFSVLSGTATQLVFTTEANTAVAGQAITPAVQVTALDPNGNPVPGFTGTVTIALGSNPASGVLSGTTMVAAVGGVATFSTLAIDKAGAGYTLTAAATGLAAATSTAFTVIAAAVSATRSTLGATPATIPASAGTSPATLTVTARDANGNPVSGATVMFAATGSGNLLTPTAGPTDANGVATGSLSSTVAGGKTVTAVVGGVTVTQTAAVTVTAGAASQLVFTGQPSTAVAEQPISPAVRVSAEDGFGNLVASYTGSVTVALGFDPAGGTLSGTKTVAAVNGVATFATLSLDKVGAGYTLTAAAPGLTGATSAAFTVVAGTATQLAFTTEPSTAVAGQAITPAVQVTALDAGGNPVPGFTGTVTIALASNPTDGILSGPTTVAAVGGVATFSTLAIDKAGTGYTLTASAPGLTGTTSTPFAVTAAAAARLLFTVQPSDAVAGQTITPAVQVTALDASGNPATGFSGSVSIALGTNPSNGTLTGTTMVAAVNGVATFTTLSVNRVGAGYTLTATATGLNGATSGAFTITVGIATQLAFTVQPGTAVAGQPITPAVQISARDAEGNLATGFTGGVSLALGADPAGGTLSGTTTVAAVGGVATFPTLSLDKVGTGYTLTAAATGLTGATSPSFTVVAGAASQLAFTAQPSNATAGAAITPAVRVTALDASGNTASGFTGTVTVALGANPGGGTLTGTTTVAAVNGVASFATLSVDKAGAGYTLTAAATGLTAATSTAFTVIAAAVSATRSTLGATPATIPASTGASPATLTVTARDANGNPVSGATVMFAATGSGNLLTPAAGPTDANGVATGSLSSTVAGGKTVTAVVGGVTVTQTAAVTVTAGAASQLVFTGQPSTAVAEQPISPAVRVSAEDGFGNLVTSYTGNVTVALGFNPAGGTLSGTTTVAAVGGGATFATLSLDKAGAGYTLTAAAPGLTGATSAAFNVVAGTATQLAFTTEPSTAVAGQAITPAVQVTALDAGGNPVPGFTGTVAIALASNPAGGTLAGTTTVAAVGGVATFATLSLDKAGAGYTLTATASGVAAATSTGFTVTAAAATRLLFTVQPSDAVAGQAISPGVKVTALDAAGNVATGFSGSVSVALGTNPNNGTLAGTTTIGAVNGVATFTTLSVNKVGTGYTLTATATGLTGATSGAFTIIPGVATQLTFTVQPGTAVAGQAISPAVQVSARDAQGNVATAFTGNVAVALGTNPGSATLSGTTTVAAGNGVATFATLSLDKVGTGYTLTAAATGLSGATSAGFSVIAGTATHLAFTTQPTNVVAGQTISPAVQVTALDVGGNPVPGFTAAVTVALATNPSAGTLTGTTTVAAVNGAASFATLSVDKVGTGYTLSATGSGLTATTSTAFNVTAAAAARLVFSVQPSDAVAGQAITPPVQVMALDANGNPASGFSGNVTVAVGTNPTGATLAGTTTVAAVNGVAAFAMLNINRAATGYTLTAASTGLAGATSTAFAITAGPASQLVFTGQPTNTVAGAAITPAVRVSAQDGFGNLAVGFAGSVTVAIGVDPAGGTLAGTTTVAAVNGVASLTTLSIDKAGTGYTLTAAATGFSGATSGPFDITPGTATQLVFTGQPSTSVAGHAITPAVQVSARDAQGNLVTGFTGSVTVAIGTNPGGAILIGVTTVAASGGIATFSSLSLDKAGAGYTLTAAATGLAGVTSAAFSVVAGPASQLQFTTQPTTTGAGVTITPAVQVTAFDPSGNIATGFAGTVTVAIGTNAGGGTLAGTTTVTAMAGVASFANLSIDKAGTGYTLTATATSVSGASSASFNVTVGPPNQLAFTVQPTTTAAGAAITPAVQVSVRDAQGNLVPSFTGSVTVAIGSNPASGTLTGTTTVAAVAGVATFSNLSLDKVGAGYTLTATSTGLAGATSATFTVVAGAASQLAFTTEPSSATAGQAISPAVKVTALDASGNTATGFAGAVTLAIGTNPAGGSLAGTTSVTAVVGVATFSAVSINKAGTGYTLTATAVGLPAAASIAFDVTAGSATVLAFAVQPTATAAGAAVTPAVQVSARDAQGNLASSFTGTVTVAIGTNPGSGTLSGTTSVAAVGGVATFSTLAIDKVGTGYTLTAASTGLPSVTSGVFNILPGPASRLAFSVQPTAATAGHAIVPAVQVSAQDAHGNLVPGFTGSVTVAIGTNPASGTLSGTTTVNAISGVATFSTLSVDKVGTGYTLTAAATGLSGATSAAFSITPPTTASQLVFTVQPVTTGAGATITPAVQVSAEDGLGNIVTAFTGSVTVAIGTNPSGGALAGTTTVTAVAGVATFSTLSINKTGTGYTLTAASSGLSGATSTGFTIAPGNVTQLVFTVQPPASTTAGATLTPAVQVSALDGVGNLVTGFTGSVSVALGANPGGGTLAGTTTVTAVSGVATFSTLSINKAGTGYTLVAAATGITGATSAAFNIVAQTTATRLAFTVQPTTTAAGATITPAVQVSAEDALGNVVTGFTGSVTVALGSNPGGGTLAGTTTVTAVAGVASFSTLSINRTGTGYTLTAAATGLTGATSAAFNISGTGAATQLAFSVQPTGAVAGATITPAVQVSAKDALGNVVTSFTGTVTLVLGTNPGGGTLAGTTSVAAVSGVATFSTLSINKTGTGYTLAASAAGLSGATSGGFNITPAVASRLAFSVQPSTTPVGSPIGPAVQVSAQDAFGNVTPSFTGTVTVSLSSNPVGGSLSGTTSVAAVNGVATFSNLSLDKPGSGYALAAATPGLTGATSASFSIVPGAATQLVFTTQPTTAVADHQITPAVKVTAEDGSGNVVTSFTGSVTVGITAGTGTAGAVLGGTTTVAAVNGVASFGSLFTNTSGTAYTLTATSSGLAQTTSASFDITPGPVNRLAFTQQPTTTPVGTAITPAVQVSAQDAFGNLVSSYTGTVTVAFAANPTGATLGGTTAVAAVTGVATFSTLTLDKSGTGYSLAASATGLTGTTSVSFGTQAGAATQLVFTVQPTITVADRQITPAVKVAAEDGSGNIVKTFTGNVTVAIMAGTGTAGATLGGTTTVTAVNGIATFSTVFIDATGTAYTLTATASGLTQAASASFDITPGAVSGLAFTVQPTATAVGAAITPAVQVTAQDAFGNLVPSYVGTVAVALGGNPTGATLGGTTAVAALNGVATFSTLTVNKTGTVYSLAASATGLTGTSSADFAVTGSGSAEQLVFTVQPTNTVADRQITPAVKVTVEDGAGNVVTSFSGTVAVAFSPGSGTAGATLGGTTTVAAVNGVATFSTLFVNTTGTGYSLTATASGLPSVASAPFAITPGPVSRLAFTVQPATTPAGAVITPPVQVSAEDQFGNLAPTYTGTITVAIGTNPSGGTLGGTTAVAAANGVATFSTLSIDKSGVRYALSASATGLTGTSSTSFTVSGGPATQLAFTVQPTNTFAARDISPSVKVTAEDAVGNIATGFTGNITVALAANPGNSPLLGTLTVAAVNGVATFTSLSVDVVANGYTLAATSPGLPAATSVPFNILLGPATHLEMSVDPVTTMAGAILGQPSVVVLAQDAGGNVVGTFSGNVTAAITTGTGTSGATLSGTTTVAAVNGAATFTNLSIDKAGTGYTLTFSTPGLTSKTSKSFNITPAAAAQLVFTVPPSNTLAGAAITPAVQVSAEDAFGNVVTSFAGSVTVAIGTNPAGGTLAGTTTVAAIGGMASFPTLSIDKVGTGYTLTAATTGVTGATSGPFNIQ